jgi:hypothetical protein
VGEASGDVETSMAAWTGYGRGGSSLLGTVLTYKYCAVVVEGTVDQLPRDSVVVVEGVGGIGGGGRYAR